MWFGKDSVLVLLWCFGGNLLLDRSGVDGFQQALRQSIPFRKEVSITTTCSSSALQSSIAPSSNLHGGEIENGLSQPAVPHVNGVESRSVSLGGPDESSTRTPEANNASDRANNKTGNGKKKKPKMRPHNPAIGDINFLRKRTAHLLRITHKDYGDNEVVMNILGNSNRANMKVDQKTFNWLIDCWSFSGELDAPERALELLGRMEELYQRGKKSASIVIRPDVRSYTKVMNALSRSGRVDAGEIAQKLFDRMEDLYSSGRNTKAKPNSFTYTSLIEAHSNSGSPGSAYKAEEYVEIMIEKFEDGDRDIRPTSRNFNAAIVAWGKSEEPGAAQYAENLLYRMEEHYEETGNAEAKPNQFNYNAAIAAWANSGDPGRAEDLLRRMETNLLENGDDSCKPSTVTYNAVIDAWAKSGAEQGPKRAEEMLRHMEDIYESGQNVDAKPNVRSFNTVINAWAKSGSSDAAFKAESVLDLMEELYEGGNEDVRPDVHSFSTVINAWARSQLKGKAERSHNLLREMKKLYEAGNSKLRPNVVAFNAVLNACAYSTGDARELNRAMEIAQLVLKELDASKFGNPDQVTYGTFFKVCGNLMADCDARQKIVNVLFRKCCKDGQVGHLVLQNLKPVTSDEEFERLTGCIAASNPTIHDLPSEWSANVVEGKWRRRRSRKQ